MFGTPLASSADAGSEENKRFLPVWKQEAVDESGKRVRFHGAFTGGFSAGYFNTVGSREGWKPKQFSSSRANSLSKKSNAPPPLSMTINDFLDEEDVENLQLSIPKLKESEKNNAPFHAEDGFERLFYSARNNNGSIGNEMLRNSGWFKSMRITEEEDEVNIPIYKRLLDEAERLRNKFRLRPLGVVQGSKSKKPSMVGFGTGVCQEDDEEDDFMYGCDENGGSVEVETGTDQFIGDSTVAPLNLDQLSFVTDAKQDGEEWQLFIDLILKEEKPNIPSNWKSSLTFQLRKASQKTSLLDFAISPSCASAALAGYQPFKGGKHLRYRKYLECFATAASTGVENLAVSDDFLEVELSEFQRAASIYKPLSGEMAKRFISASSSSAMPQPTLLSNEGKHQPKGNVDKKLLPGITFNSLNRASYAWYPTQIVLKRFGNLTDPHPEGRPSQEMQQQYSTLEPLKQDKVMEIYNQVQQQQQQQDSDNSLNLKELDLPLFKSVFETEFISTAAALYYKGNENEVNSNDSAVKLLPQIQFIKKSDRQKTSHENIVVSHVPEKIVTVVNNLSSNLKSVNVRRFKELKRKKDSTPLSFSLEEMSEYKQLKNEIKQMHQMQKSSSSRSSVAAVLEEEEEGTLAIKVNKQQLSQSTKRPKASDLW